MQPQIGIFELLWEGAKEAVPMVWPILLIIGCVGIIKLMVPRHIREGKAEYKRDITLF
jgi:hypothetical protein